MAAPALAMLFSACAFTEYGNRINQEQAVVARLEEKRHELESQYIIILNSLEKHPTDRNLTDERDKVRERLRKVSFEIEQKRTFFEQSVKEWEEKLVQERIQQEMIDREIRENAHKKEHEFGE